MSAARFPRGGTGGFPSWSRWLVGIALLAPELSGAEPPVPYEVAPYRLPTESKFEVSGIALLPDGRAALTLRKGEIWILENPLEDPARARFRRFATGLHEPLGLTWRDGALYTAQRSEVTRIADRDGDGVADLYETRPRAGASPAITTSTPTARCSTARATSGSR